MILITHQNFVLTCTILLESLRICTDFVRCILELEETILNYRFNVSKYHSISLQ